MLSLCSLVFSLSGHAYVVIFMPRSLFVDALVFTDCSGDSYSQNCGEAIARGQFSSAYTPVLNLIFWHCCDTLLQDCSSSVSKSINLQAHFSMGISQTLLPKTASPKVTGLIIDPDIYYIIPDGISK